jgi:mevalonate pyrophosphate decarboxylase
MVTAGSAGRAFCRDFIVWWAMPEKMLRTMIFFLQRSWKESYFSLVITHEN